VTANRILAAELRAMVIDNTSIPAELRKISLEAGIAMNVMSAGNFEKLPEPTKQFFESTVRDCEHAWAQHRKSAAQSGG